MTRSRNAAPERPADLKDAPTRRFWGERKPPENRSDMFPSSVLNAAGDGTAGTVATLRVYGPIDSWGGWWGISAQEVSEALDAISEDVTEIRVRINSPGGEAWEGLAILNMLRAHKARIVAVVDGLAASAASFIAAGCDETVMSPGTQMMIHDASSITWGDAAEMRKAAEFLDSVSNSVASLYAEAAGGTNEAWRALMVEETWYTAQEAVDAGLADRVAVVPDAGPTSTAGDEPEIPEDADVEDQFDLSIFNFAGRSHAPAPAARSRSNSSPAASAGGTIPTTEGATLVDFTDEQIATLRKQVGFPEDADAATITAAVTEALSEQAEDASTSEVNVPDGMQLIETSTLADLTNRATAGQAARDQQLAEHRDRVIAQAIKDGKTTKARHEYWVTSWAADPEGTEQLLTNLAAGLVPVTERGHADDEPASTDVRESAEYKNWSI